MSILLRRLHRLEARVTDSHGLVPHSEEWFNFWSDKVGQVMAGERVDLRGMTLEFIDSLIAKSNEMDNYEGHVDIAEETLST